MSSSGGRPVAVAKLFMFGAGASCSSGGTPLGKDLVWNYYEDCSTLHEMGANGQPAEANLRDKKIEFEDFGEFLQRIQVQHEPSYFHQ